MSATAFIEAVPLGELASYKSDPPLDAVSFEGSPRKHPYDPGKVLLLVFSGPGDPRILEFRLDDVVCVDQLASRVDSQGHSLAVSKLWLRRGSFGVRLEPFEVDTPLRPFKESETLMRRMQENLGS